MIKSELRADYRMQELLSLLNEGVLEVAFVKEKLAAWAGDAVELVHYSSGEYDIVMIH
jgi:hypothetical protein